MVGKLVGGVARRNRVDPIGCPLGTYYLVAVQLLDGIGAGIFGVVSVLVVADLTRGTGRFNLTQGALATATGVGAGLSNVLAGFVVQAAGFDAGFLTLAAIAAFAAVCFALAMPETLGREPPPAAPLEDRSLLATGATWDEALRTARLARAGRLALDRPGQGCFHECSVAQAKGRTRRVYREGFGWCSGSVVRTATRACGGRGTWPG